ncbi:MAG: hypothetical protein AB7G23_10295 [Vicinamibacterales bacterium]
MTTRTPRFTTLLAGGALLATALAATTPAATPRFYTDDPVWVDQDTEDASRVTFLETDLVADLAYNLIVGGSHIVDIRAGNVNTVDEVPDSSWFTGRAGRRSLTPEDIRRGPDTSTGPAGRTWTVTASKSDGVTPGFTILDAEGTRWFLKFDPPGYRGMATGTEVAVTKLMWALGYHVPENHIASLGEEQLVVGEGATITVAGRRRPMTAGDVRALLARVAREPDGSYRVVASRALEGRPVGRIRFFGTRSDDPNDIVPHEHRRELRGYGVFAAWLNHSDAKSINSLDTLVSEGGRTFVRHHLLDFGSALGSGSVAPADYWRGAEHLLDPRGVAASLVTLGFRPPRWHREPFYERPAIGRFPLDNTAFDPDGWRPHVPNRAFLHARADDRFWAARTLVALRTDLIRAAVESGRFEDAEAEDFLVRALAQRRDAIARAYLVAVNPIVDPMLDAQGHLSFGNAAVEADVAPAPARYHAAWWTFDNTTGDTDVLGATVGETTSMEAPPGLPRTPGAYVKVALWSTGTGHLAWQAPVHAYFRLLADGWRLVGFERLPEA